MKSHENLFEAPEDPVSASIAADAASDTHALPPRCTPATKFQQPAQGYEARPAAQVPCAARHANVLPLTHCRHENLPCGRRAEVQHLSRLPHPCGGASLFCGAQAGRSKGHRFVTGLAAAGVLTTCSGSTEQAFMPPSPACFVKALPYPPKAGPLFLPACESSWRKAPGATPCPRLPFPDISCTRMP